MGHGLDKFAHSRSLQTGRPPLGMRSARGSNAREVFIKAMFIATHFCIYNKPSGYARGTSRLVSLG